MAKDAALAVHHILEAIAHIEADTRNLDLEAFQADRRARQLVERNLEIISEAGRRLPDDWKTRHPAVPWKDVAGIGNILRHDYHTVSAPILWHTCHHQLAPLKKAIQAMARAPSRSKAGKRKPPKTR